MPRPGAPVIDVFHGQIQLVLMALGRATILRASIRQHPVQRNPVRLEERQHPIIQQLGGRDRRHPIIELRKAHLAIRIDEGLLVDAPDALERADVEGVLGPAIARTLTLEFAMRFFIRLGSALILRTPD
jgi:hypothetical protein